jgi:hypothetical protein
MIKVEATICDVVLLPGAKALLAAKLGAILPKNSARRYLELAMLCPLRQMMNG